jgi:hypothetical protein
LHQVGDLFELNVKLGCQKVKLAVKFSSRCETTLKTHKAGLTTGKVRAHNCVHCYEVLHAYYKRESIPCDYVGLISTWCITRSSDTAHYLYPPGLTTSVTRVQRCHITLYSNPHFSHDIPHRSVLLMQ